MPGSLYNNSPSSYGNPAYLDTAWLYLNVVYTGKTHTSHYYKWKNHFSEMKGDVGMSVHEKEGEQEDS